MEHSVLPHPSFMERLVALADRLTELRRPAEAAEALELAATLSPRDAAALEQRARALRLQDGDDELARELKRRNLEASHAMGMGQVLAGRAESDRALDLFNLAKLRAPFNYVSYRALGELHLRRKEARAALAELAQARRLNPFDLALAVSATRAALEAEAHETALEHAVAAMLLARLDVGEPDEAHRRRVETMARLCGVDQEHVERVVERSGRKLQKAADHLALSEVRILAGARRRRRREAVEVPERRPGELLRRAGELRRMGVLRHFSDDQLIQIAHLVREEGFDHAQVVFREDERKRSVYLIREGVVHITRRTAVGTQILMTCGFGSLFGEVSFVDGGARSATAFGVGTGRLFSVPYSELRKLIVEDRELAASLYWSFWRSLAEKVREANAQMGRMAPVHAAQDARARTSTGERAHVPESRKLEILLSHGLTARELRLLALYSGELKYEPEQVVFAEGEQGDQLFVVVDGHVRISRVVPGFGEEALAILGPGEVFGEMALIDDVPRSADARAHAEGCTVFSVDRSLLEEVLSMDPDAAVQFLELMCRLLCRRLRAMNDRLVAWRTMASHE